MPKSREPLVGRRFGSFVVKKLGRRVKRHTLWLCVCICGAEREVRADHLKNGRSTSCGGPLCSKRGGLSATRSYRSWTAMRSRCLDPTSRSYPNYGGRGVTICLEWLDSFDMFYRDMGERPDGMSLGRRDNNLGYSKDNCRWETNSQQSRNTRKSLRIKWEGESRLLIEVCEELDFPYTVARARLYTGWALQDIFDRKIRPKKPNRSKDELRLNRLWRRLVRAAGGWIEPRPAVESVLEQTHSDSTL
jgi:hypothetical protein